MSDASEFPTGYGGRYRSAAAAPAPPEGHFVILPAINGSLVIKSLAVGELMMSAEFPAIDQHSQHCLDSMSAVLDKVYTHSVYTLLLLGRIWLIPLVDKRVAWHWQVKPC